MSRQFQECWWFKRPCQDPGVQLSSQQSRELAALKSCIFYLGKVKRQLEQGRANIETLPSNSIAYSFQEPKVVTHMLYIIYTYIIFPKLTLSKYCATTKSQPPFGYSYFYISGVRISLLREFQSPDCPEKGNFHFKDRNEVTEATSELISFKGPPLSVPVSELFLQHFPID